MVLFPFLGDLSARHGVKGISAYGAVGVLLPRARSDTLPGALGEQRPRPGSPRTGVPVRPSGPLLAVFSVLSRERPLQNVLSVVASWDGPQCSRSLRMVSVVPPLSGTWAFAGVLAFPPGQRPYRWTVRVPRGGRVWEAARALAPLSLLLWHLYWVLQDAILPFPPWSDVDEEDRATCCGRSLDCRSA